MTDGTVRSEGAVVLAAVETKEPRHTRWKRALANQSFAECIYREWSVHGRLLLQGATHVECGSHSQVFSVQLVAGIKKAGIPRPVLIS